MADSVFPSDDYKPQYPGQTPQFTVQDTGNDQSEIAPNGPYSEEQVAQAGEWNRMLAELIAIYGDLRSAISAVGLDPDNGGTIAEALDLLNRQGSSSSAEAGDRVGWIRLTDLSTQDPELAVTDKTYQDSNNTILKSATITSLDLTFDIESSYPIVKIGSSSFTLAKAGGIYAGSVNITLAGAGEISISAVDPDNEAAADMTLTLSFTPPPTISTLSFVAASYPGAQTELKEDDVYPITGTTDRAIDLVEIQDYEAGKLAQIAVPAGTSFNVNVTIADRGDVATLRPARVRVRDAVTGAFSSVRDTNAGGGNTDGVDVVNLNNLFPSVSIGSITYPGSQQALKGSEQATVANTASDYDTIAYDSPNGELLVANSGTFENPKTVTRDGGSYNVSTNNFRVTANRAANDATTSAQAVVQIAAVAAAVTVAEPASRLRSGGNDGTSAQNHTITVAADQQLLEAPSLSPDSGGSRGTFVGSWAGGPSSWTRALQVHDDDDKGTFGWESLVATNLAGIVTNTITGDDQYTLGGFVARTVTWQAFQTQSDEVNVEVSDFSKLQAGSFSATGQQSVKYPIGTATDEENGYTIDALATNPHTVTWLDQTAAGSNTGEAYLFEYEEAV